MLRTVDIEYDTMHSDRELVVVRIYDRILCGRREADTSLNYRISAGDIHNIPL